MADGISNTSRSKYSKYGVAVSSSGGHGLGRAKGDRKSQEPNRRKSGPKKKQRREFTGAMIKRLSPAQRKAVKDLVDKDDTIAASEKLGDELAATDKMRAAAHHAHVINTLENHRINPSDKESQDAKEYNKAVIKANGVIGAQQRQRGARRR